MAYKVRDLGKPFKYCKGLHDAPRMTQYNEEALTGQYPILLMEDLKALAREEVLAKEAFGIIESND